MFGKSPAQSDFPISATGTMTVKYTTAEVDASYIAADSLARKRMPHLYRVARLFEDQDRFRAFCAVYASMRWVDDEVDEGRMTPAGLASWEDTVKCVFEGDAGDASYGPALVHTLNRYAFPQEPWQNLGLAMKYDLDHKGFPSYSDFVYYAQGATVAPAAVFATLLLMRPDADGFRPALPYGQIRDAVRPAAVACYETHILRDAKEDLREGRNYFPQDELATYKLQNVTAVDSGWQPYLRSFALRVRGGWSRAMSEMKKIESPMTPRERLMLHLLVEFYGHSLEKIIRQNCNVWSDAHWPEPEEVAQLLARIGAQHEPDVDLSALAVRVIEDV